MSYLMKNPIQILMLSIFLLGACSSTPQVPTDVPVKSTHPSQPTESERDKPPEPKETIVASPPATTIAQDTAVPTSTLTKGISDDGFANVRSVAISGSENAYTFAVEIRSPDSGCEQYANWWEVISEDGELIYRRILGHSHVSEQPFTRSGGPVTINADTVVIVRAHMHPHGYGGAAFRGSVRSGFEGIQFETDFAPELEKVNPLPEGCAF